MEITEYADNKYGTTFAAVEEVTNNGLICLMNVHYSAAQKIERMRPGWAHFIFITVSGRVHTLRQRLQDRGEEKSNAVERRLQKAVEEFDFVDTNRDFFDCVLSNDGNIDDSVDALAKVMGSWYPRFEQKRRTMICDDTAGTNKKIIQHFVFPALSRNKCVLPALFFNFGVAWCLVLDVNGIMYRPSWSLTM